MSVTMKDIAVAAGVSVGTVDRALHNRDRIAPDVKQRVLLVADKMGYKQTMVARSLLVNKRHYKIAVVLHVHKNDFYSDIRQGINRAKQEIFDLGIDVEIYFCNDFDVQEQLHLIDTAISNGASALAIVPIDDSRISKKLTQLHDQNFPVLFLSSSLEKTPCLSAVRCNYKKSGIIAAGLVRLISKDPGKVLLFTPSLSMEGHRQRIEGFKRTLSQNAPDIILKEIIELPNDSFESYNIASDVIALNKDVNFVVYCGNSRAGLKAIRECKHIQHSVFYDCTSYTEAALLKKEIDAVIIQNPQEQGFLAIKTLSNFLITQIPPDSLIEVSNSILIPESIGIGQHTELLQAL